MGPIIARSDIVLAVMFPKYPVRQKFYTLAVVIPRRIRLLYRRRFVPVCVYEEARQI